MTKSLYLKRKSINLRKKGYTYSEIQKELGVKILKNTLSYWCRGVTLPYWYDKKVKKLNALNLEKARIRGRAIIKQKRKNLLSYLSNKNSSLIKEIKISTQKLLLSMLYLGEGNKFAGATLMLGSTNASIIKLYMKLLRNCFFVEDSKFRIRIQCRYDQNIKSLENYWVKTTGISRKQFYPTYIDKRTQGKPTLKKNYKGICTVHYLNREIKTELILLADAIIGKIV